MKSVGHRLVAAQNLLGLVAAPMLTGAAAAGVTAWMVSLGQWAVAMAAVWFGLLGCIPLGFLAIAGPERRLSRRWPWLWHSGWRPGHDPSVEQQLEDLYRNADAALAVLFASRRTLGVDLDTARITVRGLVVRARAVAEHRRGLEALLEHQEAEARFHARVEHRRRRNPEVAHRLEHATAAARADRRRQDDARRAIEACDDDLAAMTSALVSLRGRIEATRLDLLADPRHRDLALREALADLNARASTLEAASQTLTRTQEVFQ